MSNHWNFLWMRLICIRNFSCGYILNHLVKKNYRLERIFFLSTDIIRTQITSKPTNFCDEQKNDNLESRGCNENRKIHWIEWIIRGKWLSDSRQKKEEEFHSGKLWLHVFFYSHFFFSKDTHTQKERKNTHQWHHLAKVVSRISSDGGSIKISLRKCFSVILVFRPPPCKVLNEQLHAYFCNQQNEWEVIKKLCVLKRTRKLDHWEMDRNTPE